MIFQKIKSTLTIKQVVEFYGVKFKMGKAICPLHIEKTPSFVIYTKNQTFQCMGCKQGGDVITFVSKLFGITNGESLRKLDHDFNLGGIKKLTRADRINFKRQEHLKKIQIKEAKKKENEYWQLWEVFAEYDKICIDNKPDKFGVSDLWLFANNQREMYWSFIENYKGDKHA